VGEDNLSRVPVLWSSYCGLRVKWIKERGEKKKKKMEQDGLIAAKTGIGLLRERWMEVAGCIYICTVCREGSGSVCK
jgi:hypothetical protein